MNALIGLLIIAVGSLGQSSSYVPIKKVRNWSWESFWIVQGIFAWFIFPLLGAMMATPAGKGFLDLYAVESASILKSIGFGALWGIGGLTFGLSMRYLGVALGQSLALGTCAAFGTLFPAMMKGDNLFSGSGLVLLIGVSITLAGIAIIGYAGALRSQNMTEKQKKEAMKDFALKKGILIALLAGAMSACFSLGLDAGDPIKQNALSMGAKDLFALNPVILLVTIGGLLTNFAYCFFRISQSGNLGDFYKLSASDLINNFMYCALAGILWYSQFFGLGMGQSYFEPGSVMLAFSWSILMSLNVTFSNLWGIILKEWSGAGMKVMAVLMLGMAVLIFSLIFPNIF